MGKQCKKKKYRDELSVMIALADCHSSRNPKRMETRYYWCEECNAYHLTKLPRRRYNG